MKIKLLFFTSTFFLYSTLAFGQFCGGDCDNENIFVTGNTLIASGNTTPQEYFWEICTGTAAIVGSNTESSVTISSSGTYRIRLVRFENGTCTTSCKLVDGGNPSCAGICPIGISSSFNVSQTGCTDIRFEVFVTSGCLAGVNWNWDASCCGIGNGSATTQNNQLTLTGLSFSTTPLTISASVIYEGGEICPTISRSLQIECP